MTSLLFPLLFVTSSILNFWCVECYHRGSSAMKQSEADLYCMHRYNSHLATILDGNDQRAAKKECNGRCWIGLSDRDKEGTFKWNSGGTLNGGYTKWKPGEPNNKGGEDCVELKVGGGWNDVRCSAKRIPLCDDSPFQMRFFNAQSETVKVIITCIQSSDSSETKKETLVQKGWTREIVFNSGECSKVEVKFKNSYQTIKYDNCGTTEIECNVPQVSEWHTSYTSIGCPANMKFFKYVIIPPSSQKDQTLTAQNEACFVFVSSKYIGGYSNFEIWKGEDHDLCYEPNTKWGGESKANQVAAEISMGGKGIDEYKYNKFWDNDVVQMIVFVGLISFILINIIFVCYYCLVKNKPQRIKSHQ